MGHLKKKPKDQPHPVFIQENWRQKTSCSYRKDFLRKHNWGVSLESRRNGTQIQVLRVPRPPKLPTIFFSSSQGLLLRSFPQTLSFLTGKNKFPFVSHQPVCSRNLRPSSWPFQYGSHHSTYCLNLSLIGTCIPLLYRILLFKDHISFC